MEVFKRSSPSITIIMIKYKAQLCLPIEFLMTCLMAGNECRKVNVTLDTQSNTSICSTWCAIAVQVLFFRENNLSQGEEPLPNIILISMPPSSPSWSIWSSINRLFGWGHHKHDSYSSSSRFKQTGVCMWDHYILWVIFFDRLLINRRMTLIAVHCRIYFLGPISQLTS